MLIDLLQKINATNSWSFALIDYFHDMSLLRNDTDNSINFQKASRTLDGCVKIWTSRVDSVGTDTGKLLSNLAEEGRELRNLMLLTLLTFSQVPLLAKVKRAKKARVAKGQRRRKRLARKQPWPKLQLSFTQRSPILSLLSTRSSRKRPKISTRVVRKVS